MKKSHNHKKFNKQRFSDREIFRKKVLFELGVFSSDCAENVQCDGLGIDISRYGLGLTTEYELKRSQVIKLYFPAKDTKATLPVFAEVVWTKPVDNSLRAGLRFLT